MTALRFFPRFSNVWRFYATLNLFDRIAHHVDLSCGDEQQISADALPFLFPFKNRVIDECHMDDLLMTAVQIIDSSNNLQYFLLSLMTTLYFE